MNNVNIIKPNYVQNVIDKFCYTIGMLPASYKVSLSYEEQILCIGNYLEQTIYPAINNNAAALAQLQNLFLDLKNYVENYFNNLDVQEEVNNKIDALIESGQLVEILAPFNFNYINVKTLGAKGDGTTDDTTSIKNAIALNKPLYFPEGTYIVSETITLENDINWLGQGEKTIINSRPISDLNPNYITPVLDFSNVTNLRLCGFSSSNSTIKILPSATESQTVKQLMRDKSFFIQNVTNNIENNNMPNKTNWQGMFINTPAPDNYNRNFNNGKYPRYAIDISNNSGYNAINIDNMIYDDEGNIATVVDNSAIGIRDGVIGSSPTIFVDMHSTRNALNIKNNSDTSTANSTSNPNSVFQIGFQGHLGIGCSVYNETGAEGTASIKIKDSNPRY